MNDKKYEQVTFILRGERFQILRSTLYNHDSYLNTLVSERWGTTPNNEFVIDRNPKSFQHILDYLQGYELAFELMDETTLNLVKQDADFYSLTELSKSIDLFRRWSKLPEMYKNVSLGSLRTICHEILYYLNIRQEDYPYLCDKETLDRDLLQMDEITLAEYIDDLESRRKKIKEVDHRKNVKNITSLYDKSLRFIVNKSLNLGLSDDVVGHEDEGTTGIIYNFPPEQLQRKLLEYYGAAFLTDFGPSLIKAYKEYKKPLYYRCYEYLYNKASTVFNSQSIRLRRFF